MKLHIDIIQPDRFHAGGVVGAKADLVYICQQDAGIGMGEAERLDIGSAVGAGVINLPIDHSNSVIKNRKIEGAGANAFAGDTGKVVGGVFVWIYAVGHRDWNATDGDFSVGAPIAIAEVASVTYIDLAQIVWQGVVDKGGGAIDSPGLEPAVGQA